MIDFIFAMVAIAAASNPAEPDQKQSTQDVASAQTAAQSTVVIGEGVNIGSAALIGDKPANKAVEPQLDLTVFPDGLIAEPQNPEGKFTTATEVKPILTATKGNWVALRDFGGQDLVYVTHLWAWRCGLSAMALSINDGPMKNVPLPACHPEYAAPNAILEEDGLPYLTYPQGSVERIAVQIIYDDLSHDMATFSSDQIRIP